MYQALNAILILLCALYMGVEKWIQKKPRKYIYGMLIIAAALLFAFRPENTKDTMGYIESFNNPILHLNTGISLLQKYDGYEIGYIYLMRIFRLVTTNYRAFFFFISFVGLAGTLYGLNRLSVGAGEVKKRGNSKPRVGAVLAIYISNYGFLYHGISVRAGLSFALGMMFFLNMRMSKRFTGLVYLILAFVIQRTSFLFLVAYIIYKYLPPIKREIHLIIWVLSGLLMLSGIASMAFVYIIKVMLSIIERFGISGYNAYLKTLDVAVGLTDIYKWLLYGLLIMICDTQERNQRYLNIVMAGALIVVFLHDVRAVSRAYDIFYLFIIPLLVQFFNKNMRYTSILSPLKRTITFGVIVVGAASLFVTCFG